MAKNTSIFGELRQATKMYRRVSENGRRSGDDFLCCDRFRVGEYMGKFPRVEKVIVEYLRSLRDGGKRVVHVDICGRATAEHMGADVSYCFSLAPDDLRKSLAWKRAVFVDGDIFNERDFSELIGRLDSNGDVPALVTFEPVAGLCGYERFFRDNPRYSEVMYAKLEKRLRAMIDILGPGGYIFIGSAFQGQSSKDFFSGKSPDQYEISLYLRGMAKELKCALSIMPHPCGPYYLIRKHLNAKRRK